MVKGKIKVMVGRTGTKIQEELNDQIRVYTVEQWNAELERRRRANLATDQNGKTLEELEGSDEDIEDNDEEEDLTPRPTRARGRKAKATKKSQELSDADSDDGDFEGEND